MMIRHPGRRRVAAVLGALLMAPWSAATAADIVTLTPDATTKGAIGGAFRGVITAESTTKVEIKTGNTVSSIPINEIASISYDAHPGSLDQAQTKETAGALAEAIELYKKAAGEASTKPFIVEEAAFGQARATAELAQGDPAKVNEAIALLDTFSKTYKAGRHVPLALESLAKLQIARENYAGAEATLGSLAKLPGGDDRSAALRIRMLSKKGQAAEAIAEIDKAIAAHPEGSSRKRDAILAKADALTSLKKYAEAEALVRGVIRGANAEDAATQAAAHNTLGDCMRAAGKPKEALYAYLHTDLLFSKDKEEHARSLSQIAQLWRELKKPERADDVLERLKTEYPRSPYAQAANP